MLICRGKIKCTIVYYLKKAKFQNSPQTYQIRDSEGEGLAACMLTVLGTLICTQAGRPFLSHLGELLYSEDLRTLGRTVHVLLCSKKNLHSSINRSLVWTNLPHRPQGGTRISLRPGWSSSLLVEGLERVRARSTINQPGTLP